MLPDIHPCEESPGSKHERKKIFQQGNADLVEHNAIVVVMVGKLEFQVVVVSVRIQLGNVLGWGGVLVLLILLALWILLRQFLRPRPQTPVVAAG